MAFPGFWVVFEGADGVGKTTQVDLLAAHLRSPAGGAREVLTTREPGGTPLGIELRQAIMHGDHVAPRAEALLYAADRAHHIATLVRPALEAGTVVLQDRYLDSSVVYQGGARGLGEEVERISLWATEGLLPDLTVVLDMEPDPARMSRDLDRVERETIAKAAQMREGFLGRAALDRARYAVVDAARTVEEVHASVVEAVTAAMARRDGLAVEPWGTP
ncbi:dTMP kinase [Demequina iriomotensis]|uniref:dTMP kinase n=1 Tax=Demequina iriomotensis TaxID=1536641 RepID=UPI0012E06703|nr:dTMP kinase [Demequina iriomotensis]